MILKTLRGISKPIHDRIDRHGLSQAIKNNTVTRQDYYQWLINTYRINIGINEMAAEKFNDDHLYQEYIKPFDHFDLLKKDLIALGNDNVDALPAIHLPSQIDKYSIIPLSYTYLGSHMGMKIITDYLMKEKLSWSNEYLLAIVNYPNKWSAYVRDLQRLDIPDDMSSIAEYTLQLWNTIESEII